MKKDIISSTMAQKILDFLCQNPYQAFYGAQIASKVHISKGGTNQELHKMAKLGLLKAERKGRMIFYRVDSKSALVKQFKVLRNITALQRLVEKITPHSERIVLFGSCAHGEDSEESDIDIFVVSGDKEKIRRLVLAERIKREIQLVVKSPQEYISFDKKDPVFYEQIKKGIVLWERE